MTESDNNLIAFSGLAHAQDQDAFFNPNSVAKNFHIYMDEEIHSDPGQAVNAKCAGVADAKKTPPDPDSESQAPPDGSYVAKVYLFARKFFDTYSAMYELWLNAYATRVRDILQQEVWSPERFDTSEFERATHKHSERQAEFEAYKDANKDKVANQLLDPKPPLPLSFTAQVLFVVVFEFVLVWFFLSEQLGLAGAIYVSLVATTLVVLLAGLCAFSKAYTAKDLEPSQVAIGYAGLALCIFLFAFGIGILSGWRADSTGEGLALVGAGFQAFTKIDVFVTAIFNFAGFVFLTWEFKRFFWPSPLFHFGERQRSLRELEEEREGIRDDLLKALNEACKALREDRKQVDNLLRNLHKFEEDSPRKLSDLAKQVEDLAADYQGEYLTGNLKYRTREAYEAPSWLEECSLTIDAGDRGEEMQKRLGEYRQELAGKREEFAQQVDLAVEQIDQALEQLGKGA